MYAVLALSWDFAARAELVSFAHTGFFGLGAYTSAVTFLKLGFPLYFSFAVAVLLTIVVAIALGYLTLRLSGIYFAIASLAFSEVLLVVALQLPKVTGGAMGISVPSLFGGMRVYCYGLILGILILAIAVSIYLERSHFHLAFSAMRTSQCRFSIRCKHGPLSPGLLYPQRHFFLPGGSVLCALHYHHHPL